MTLDKSKVYISPSNGMMMAFREGEWKYYYIFNAPPEHINKEMTWNEMH